MRSILQKKAKFYYLYVIQNGIKVGLLKCDPIITQSILNSAGNVFQ